MAGTKSRSARGTTRIHTSPQASALADSRATLEGEIMAHILYRNQFLEKVARYSGMTVEIVRSHLKGEPVADEVAYQVQGGWAVVIPTMNAQSVSTVIGDEIGVAPETVRLFLWCANTSLPEDIVDRICAALRRVGLDSYADARWRPDGGGSIVAVGRRRC
jgi:hypothetical protein